MASKSLMRQNSRTENRAPTAKKVMMMLISGFEYFYAVVYMTQMNERLLDVLTPNMHMNMPAPPIQTFTLKIVSNMPSRHRIILDKISIFLPRMSPRKEVTNMPIKPPLYIRVIIKSIQELYSLQRQSPNLLTRESKLLGGMQAYFYA